MHQFSEQQNEEWQVELAADLNKLIELMEECEDSMMARDWHHLQEYVLPLQNVIQRVADFEDIQ